MLSFLLKADTIWFNTTPNISRLKSSGAVVDKCICRNKEILSIPNYPKIKNLKLWRKLHWTGWQEYTLLVKWGLLLNVLYKLILFFCIVSMLFHICYVFCCYLISNILFSRGKGHIQKTLFNRIGTDNNVDVILLCLDFFGGS